MVGIRTGIYKCQHNRNFDFSVENILLGSLVWENMKQFDEVTVMLWFTGKKRKGFQFFPQFH